MPSQQSGKGKNRKTGNKSVTTKPSATPIGTQSIVVKIRSSASKDKPTTAEEFGSVWFRNHNPNAIVPKPSLVEESTNTLPSPAATSTSGPPLTSLTSTSQSSPQSIRMAPNYDLASVPPWARYRLPPTTPHPPSLTAKEEPQSAPVPSSNGMSSSAVPFDISAICPRPPSQLYPFTTEGLSTEMFDYVLSMQLTDSEREAREALKTKIERVVAMLWPAVPADEVSFPRSAIPSPLMASSLTSEEATSGPATPLPMSLDSERELQPKKLSASVILFGSYALGLATPSSDLDLSVVFNNLPESQRDDHNSGDASGSDPLSEQELRFQRYTAKVPSFECLRLRELAEALRSFDETVEVRVLEECRVPVAHVIDLPTGVSADISINMPHMATVVTMQKSWLDAEEAIEGTESSKNSKVKALILLTKLALRQWGMGCSFTGGLSSTGVYLLVERYLREGREAGCVPTPLPPLSKLLIDFWLYLSSDMFQHGFLASDVFHITNCRTGTIGGAPSFVPSALSSPREGTCSLVPDEYCPTPAGVSPTAPDAPHSFPTVVSPGTLTRTSSITTAALPDVTRRCTRMGEIQFLFRHSATTLEQLIASGPKNVWTLPLTPLSSVLADPRLSIPKRSHPRQPQLYRPTKAAPRDGHDGATRSDRSSTPGASSNGSEVAVSPPSVKSSIESPVRFKSSLKNFVGAPCFIPKKLLATPPPSYESLEN